MSKNEEKLLVSLCLIVSHFVSLCLILSRFFCFSNYALCFVRRWLQGLFGHEAGIVTATQSGLVH